MKKSRTATVISEALQKELKRVRLSQLSVAEKLDMNQSQVSRIVRGEFKRLSPNVLKLCELAQINVSEVLSRETGHSQHSERLREIVDAVWDGTPQHERALIKVIRSLRHLSG